MRYLWDPAIRQEHFQVCGVPNPTPSPPTAVADSDATAGVQRIAASRDAGEIVVAAAPRSRPPVVQILGIGVLLLAWPLFRPIYKTDPRWRWLAALLYWGWIAFIVTFVIVGLRH